MSYIYKTYKYDKDAFAVFNALRDKRGVFFLDSALNFDGLGRYSFLGFNPEFTLKSASNENPFPLLRNYLNKFSLPKNLRGLSPFLCGFAGYFSYDLGFILEKIKRRIKDDLRLPGAYLGFYGAVITIDHVKKTLTVFSSGLPEKNTGLAGLKAKERFKEITGLLAKIDEAEKREHLFRARNLKSNFSQNEYIRAVDKVKRYIGAGDIYQLNLSQRFTVDCKADAFSLYRRMRGIFPAAFCGYFDAGAFKILSSSPERFLQVKAGRVITRPMKGTRARGSVEDEDNSLREELLNSEKDKAELLMIVDLERNDLGRVCEYKSIKVTRPRILETYTTVFQTTSEIEGMLHKNKDRLDLIKACFPGGSITGCPKIRAMEIIEELEPVRRNIYTGALGYLDLAGNMDLNILIRTLLLKNDKIYFNTGGGIVADSNPQAEYEETLVKAEAIFKALGVKHKP